MEIYMDSGGGVEDARRIAAGIQNNVWHHLVLTYNGSDTNWICMWMAPKITTWTQFGGPLDVRLFICLVLHAQQTKMGEASRMAG